MAGESRPADDYLLRRHLAETADILANRPKAAERDQERGCDLAGMAKVLPWLHGAIGQVENVGDIQNHRYRSVIPVTYQ